MPVRADPEPGRFSPLQKAVVPSIAPIVRPDDFKPVKQPIDWEKPTDASKRKSAA